MDFLGLSDKAGQAVFIITSSLLLALFIIVSKDSASHLVVP
jgi:hypothetical protein